MKTKTKAKHRKKALLGEVHLLDPIAPAPPAPVIETVQDDDELISPEDLQSLAWMLGIASAVGLGGYFGIRYFVRSTRQKATESQSLTAGSAASYASRLKMAFENDNFFGWGTDEAVIKNIFQEISSQKLYADVQKSYSSLFPGRQLNMDLREELDSTEYNKIIELLNSKPLQ